MEIIEQIKHYWRDHKKVMIAVAVVIEKFEKLASKRLPEEKVGELRDTILNIEEVEDAVDIARLLSID